MVHIKKICLVILCSFAVVPASRADGLLSAIAGYGTLYQLGSSHPGWLTFPALVGGAVCAKLVDTCCYLCSSKARKELDEILVKASSAHKQTAFEKNALILDLMHESTHLLIIEQICSIARILGTVATAYGLTLIKK